MINLLIWSKDRACQLDLLLGSLPQGYFDVDVLFKVSNDDFDRGYTLLKSKYPNVNFIREAVFHVQTMDCLAKAKYENKTICVSTDDTVFYRHPNLKWYEISDLITEEVCTFSFRYGLNTTLQNHNTGEIQPSLNIYEDNHTHIRWRFDNYHPLHNYGYPFGLDMHVYDGDLLFQLAQNIEFNNTNQLESGLFQYTNVVPRIVCAEKISTAVNIPCNNMSGITLGGQQYPFDVEYLNRMFLEGYTINLEPIQKLEFNSCHFEIPLELIKS